MEKKQHVEMAPVLVSLKCKIKDDNLDGVKVRTRRNWLKERLEVQADPVSSGTS